MKATKIEFARRYLDDSGVRIGARYDETRDEPFRVAVFSGDNSIHLEAEDIGWLISALYEIQDQVKKPAKP